MFAKIRDMGQIFLLLPPNKTRVPTGQHAVCSRFVYQ